jgi:hypothetical protein
MIYLFIEIVLKINNQIYEVIFMNFGLGYWNGKCDSMYLKVKKKIKLKSDVALLIDREAKVERFNAKTCSSGCRNRGEADTAKRPDQ